MMISFIDWDAPIKEGRKNDTCPKCVTKNMKRKGKMFSFNKGGFATKAYVNQVNIKDNRKNK